MLTIEKDLDILLISLPWVDPSAPSIQLGILQHILERDGFRVASYSAFLDFYDYIIEHGDVSSPFEYMNSAFYSYSAEWIFATPMFMHDQTKSRNIISKYTNDIQFAKLEKIKPVAESFLDAICHAIVTTKPKVIGFSTTFNQTIASLALGQMVKQLAPDIRIVMGGAHCQGTVGASILQHFPWIDVVVHDEAEEIISPVMEALLTQTAQMPAKGVSWREATGELTINCNNSPTTPVNKFVIPNYDEYFKMLDNLSFAKGIKSIVSIPFENSRGCWWGQKQHCTFCALNGESMAFRSKTPEHAMRDLRALVHHHQHYQFNAVDNIMDYRYHNSFIHELNTADLDLELFFETKSNLSIKQLVELRRAGVTSIQPGIESLDTSILILINKGVTGIKNIRLLKYCAWLDIDVKWNLISGFPGEDKEAYTRMSEIIPSITHYSPPNFTPLALMRFSPYFEDTAKYGIINTGPDHVAEALLPVPKDSLASLSFDFRMKHIDKREPAIYTKKVRSQIEIWNEIAESAKNTLRYFRTGNSIIITDDRPNLQKSRTNLDQVESHIYRACDDIATISQLLLDPVLQKAKVTRQELEIFIEQLEEARLVHREGDQVLSLAIPGRDRIRIP